MLVYILKDNLEEGFETVQSSDTLRLEQLGNGSLKVGYGYSSYTLTPCKWDSSVEGIKLKARKMIQKEIKSLLKETTRLMALLTKFEQEL